MNPFVCLLIMLLFCGCSINKTAAKVTSGIIDDGLDTVFAQSDTEYVREALPANLQLMEILLQSDKDDKKLLTNAAMGFCGYSLMFLEDDNNERASTFYKKGEMYAERAISGRKLEDLTKEDAPALFWNTFCKASYINLNKHKPAAINELGKLEPAINKMLELDPEYYYNGAYILLGAYYSIRPTLFGGNPVKAQEYFEKALTGKGQNFLMTKFVYAKMVAPAILDEELFTKLLSEIAEQTLIDGPERLPNEIAKKKAKILLEKKDEIF